MGKWCDHIMFRAGSEMKTERDTKIKIIEDVYVSACNGIGYYMSEYTIKGLKCEIKNGKLNIECKNGVSIHNKCCGSLVKEIDDVSHILVYGESCDV